MNKDQPIPRFITFEGGEGAGKTTLIDAIEKMLVSYGTSIVKTREPGGTVLGDQIRTWLLKQDNAVRIDGKAELMLFLAARAQHIEEVIFPSLLAGKVVLCDRYNDSTVAYQGAGRKLGVDWVSHLCKMVCQNTLPDLTFYLDVDPQIGLERTKSVAKEEAHPGKLDRIEAEKHEFHQRVRDAFLEISKAEPKRLIFVDANQSQSAVVEAVKHIILKRFYV